jgi:hypothetical protein
MVIYKPESVLIRHELYHPIDLGVLSPQNSKKEIFIV